MYSAHRYFVSVDVPIRWNKNCTKKIETERTKRAAPCIHGIKISVFYIVPADCKCCIGSSWRRDAVFAEMVYCLFLAPRASGRLSFPEGEDRVTVLAGLLSYVSQFNLHFEGIWRNLVFSYLFRCRRRRLHCNFVSTIKILWGWMRALAVSAYPRFSRIRDFNSSGVGSFWGRGWGEDFFGELCIDENSRRRRNLFFVRMKGN